MSCSSAATGRSRYSLATPTPPPGRRDVGKTQVADAPPAHTQHMVLGDFDRANADGSGLLPSFALIGSHDRRLFGVQQISQIRGPTAPETRSETIAVGARQYVQQLDSAFDRDHGPQPAPPSRAPSPRAGRERPIPAPRNGTTYPGAGDDLSGLIPNVPGDLAGLTSDDADILPLQRSIGMRVRTGCSTTQIRTPRARRPRSSNAPTPVTPTAPRFPPRWPSRARTPSPLPPSTSPSQTPRRTPGRDHGERWDQ